MSLGVFGAFLVGILVVLCVDGSTRLRTVVAALAGLMLGLVIAGSNGVLVEPSRNLVDAVRSGLATIGRQIGGDAADDRPSGTTRSDPPAGTARSVGP